LPLFQGAIPSKVFEALAMKKPLLLGVDGEARKHFIEKANAGLFFIPEDEEDLAHQIRKLVDNPNFISEMGTNARNYVSNHFNRDKIAAEFLEVLENNL
jgi:glycosyltransferase involved in cell wall biosynthesis